MVAATLFSLYVAVTALDTFLFVRETGQWSVIPRVLRALGATVIAAVLWTRIRWAWTFGVTGGAILILVSVLQLTQYFLMEQRGWRMGEMTTLFPKLSLMLVSPAFILLLFRQSRQAFVGQTSVERSPAHSPLPELPQLKTPYAR